MFWIKTLLFLTKEDLLGVSLYFLSLLLFIIGYKVQKIFYKKANKISLFIPFIFFALWVYSELRASGLIIFPNDKTYFMLGPEHLNHGVTLAFFSAPFFLGSIAAFGFILLKTLKQRKESNHV